MVCAPPVFAIYVHNLNPIALPIYGSFALRWYGLAYLLGFVCGFLLLRNLARRGLWVLKPEKTADFIAAAALFGVFLGGRLGYILFYDIPAHGWASLARDPLLVFRVWEGGMASHGGILGLVIFTFFYARRHKVSWTGLGDGLCVVAPLGLMFGRLANFVNGELYGRVAHGVAWAMKFPLALGDSRAPESLRFDEAAAAALRADPKLNGAWQAMQTATDATYPAAHSQYFEAMLEANRHSPAVTKAIEPYLEPRHPSQLYECLLEGLALFSILYFVRVKFPKAPHGLLTGLFFALYAVFRIFGEQFREPDAELVGAFSKGQFFSFFMFLFAAAFFVHAWRGWKRGREANPEGI
jgi:phosphatidylglycerol:prolipoprotein diacylglycerol transferase